jgi:hypothetical protein
MRSCRFTVGFAGTSRYNEFDLSRAQLAVRSKEICMTDLSRELRRWGTLLVLAAAFAGCAREPVKPLVTSDIRHVTATVAAVDLSTRIVSLRNEQGMATVEAGPEVRNLDKVKVGDKVVVSYFEGVAAELKKHGEGVKGVDESTTTARTGTGDRPAGAIGHTVTTTVTIESVDKTFNIVTFRRQDGLVRTVTVKKPESREFIRTLKHGDEVEVTYTEAVAVTVEPAP